MKLILNKNKCIGKVIYVVEGDVTESLIIKKVFNNVLGYNVVEYNKVKDEYIELASSTDKYSKVYIIPSKYSAINKVFEINDYLLNIYQKLAINYELDIENSAVYYLFDRDRKSNRPASIYKAFDKLANARDNDDYEMNGLMLMSYPSIEAFYCNCYSDYIHLASGMEAKEISTEYLDDYLHPQQLINASDYVLEKICDITNQESFDLDCLNNFEDINIQIFEYEEQEFFASKGYDTLSLLFISLIDIGIIEIDDVTN